MVKSPGSSWLTYLTVLAGRFKRVSKSLQAPACPCVATLFKRRGKTKWNRGDFLTYSLKSKPNLKVRLVGARPYISTIVVHHSKYYYHKILGWAKSFAPRTYWFVCRDFCDCEQHNTNANSYLRPHGCLAIIHHSKRIFIAFLGLCNVDWLNWKKEKSGKLKWALSWFSFLDSSGRPVILLVYTEHILCASHRLS